MSDAAPVRLKRNAAVVARAVPLLRAAMRLYFRAEARDVDRIPEGGALLVGNHSGGILAMDVPVLYAEFVRHFGPERPFYVLAHDLMFTGIADPVARQLGFVPATRRYARAVLEAGAATVVYPGGDHDVMRPSRLRHVIDFDGRTGYVRTALQAGVPIVPVVGIGGQEAQWFITRGESIARALRLERLIRAQVFPISFGFPFGFSATVPPNLPLPTKLIAQVLDPIDPATEFGPDPDIAEIDAEVRRRMQVALDRLAAERRFPVLG